MKQQKESSGVSIANIITIIGLIAFGVVTYLGQLYLNDGDITSSILWAIGFAIIAGALSFGAAALKGRKIDAKLMIIVQIVILIIYIGFAFLSSRATLKFFDVQGDKATLAAVASEDIAKTLCWLPIRSKPISSWRLQRVVFWATLTSAPKTVSRPSISLHARMPFAHGMY